MKKFWENFCAASGREGSYVRSICFGLDKDAANRAAEKAVCGEKRAMIYPADGYLRREPCVGDLNIVCDWQEKPRAVIETTAVEHLPLARLTDAHCRMEAEADDLAAWKESCLPAIRTELEEIGLELCDSSMLIVESFKTIYAAE